MDSEPKTPILAKLDLIQAFPRDSQFKPEGWSNMIVRGKLNDGFCPGGQEFEIKIRPNTFVSNPESLKIDRAAQILQFTVGGRNLMSGKDEWYLVFKPKTIPVTNTVTNSDFGSFHKSVYFPEPIYRLDKGQLLVDAMSTGDDLAAIFHELGHVEKWEEETKGKLREHIDEKKLPYWVVESQLGITDLFSKMPWGKRKIFEAKLWDENEASRRGLGIISNLRSEGVDLFPGDVGLERVQQFFRVASLTYLKALIKRDPEIIRRIGKNKINQIFEF